MGQYVVNGEVIDIRGDRPTAADVKQVAGAPAADWVMAVMPGGKVVRLRDAEVVPAETESLSTTVPFSYGR